MTTKRKMSQVGMACSMIVCWWQEAFQFAIIDFQASATTAQCTMKIYFQTIFCRAVTARVFMAEGITLSAFGAVQVLLAVIIADKWSGLWGRWWGRRRRGGSVQVEGGEGWHLRPPQRHDPAPPWGWRWRKEVAEWARGRWRRKSGRRIYLSQSGLAGSCPLVAAGSRSCATVAAASTTSCLVARSWWRGWSWRCSRWWGWWRLKLKLECRLASLWRESQRGSLAGLLQFFKKRFVYLIR